MTPRHFAWQAWHLVTSTFVSRGRRGTISHPPWFCVAGVALMTLPRPPLPPAACHTQHNFVTHHLFTYNFHTQLCQPPSFTYLFSHTTFTHNFVTHHLSHTLFHTPFCHTPSFNFVRHSSSSSSSRRPPVTHNTLSHTPSFTHNFHTQLCQPHGAQKIMEHLIQPIPGPQ